MDLNQNETGTKEVLGARRWVLVPGLSHQSTSAQRLAPSALRTAFTLTELLVVITIIAILAGLVTGAAINALNKAKQAAITLELQSLGQAMEDFKTDYGAYPPNGMRNQGYMSFAVNDFMRMFRKAFPRHQEPDSLIEGLAGIGTSTTTTEVLYVDATNRGMNGAEALVFWLGGFSKDPRLPISGPGGPSFDRTVGLTDEVLENRNRRYEFDLGRLGPRNASGQFDQSIARYIEYDIDLNGDGDETDSGEERRINMWFYTPSGSQQPIAYFDASRHRAQVESSTTSGTFENNYDPFFGQLSPAFTDSLFALKRRNETNPNRIEFMNQGKFQILHAGLDDAWGDFSVMYIGDPGDLANSVLMYPEGPFIGDVADTVGNFITGTLEEAQE